MVAELGVNHGGDPAEGAALVDAAHRAGADAIKLQLFETPRLLSRAATLAAYQVSGGSTDPWDLLAPLELPAAAMAGLVARAHDHGLHAIVTPFSSELVPVAEQIGWDAYKVASPDIVNRPLIAALMETSRPLLLSTGAATLEEVHRAAGWLGGHPHVLMQCVSCYPTPDEEAHLGALATLATLGPAPPG